MGHIQSMWASALKPLDNEENSDGGHQPRIEFIGDLEQGPCAHAAEIPDGIGERIGTEEHPCQGGAGESQEYRREVLEMGFGPRWCMLPVLAAQQQGEEEQSIDRTLCKEGPVGTMPEAAEEEDDEHVADL